jgi:hypothetical protein
MHLKNQLARFCLLAVLALGLIGTMPAFAAYELSISGAGSCMDPGACAAGFTLVGGPGTGVISFSGSSGSVVSVTAGLAPPTVSLPVLMDVSSVNVATTGAAVLTVTWSATGYTLPIPPNFFVMNAGGTVTAPAGSSVLYEAFVDSGNVLSATTTLIGSLSFGTNPFSGSFSSPVLAGGNPYSLTQRLTFTFTGRGTASGDFELAAVPEPASVILFGGILLLTVGAIRRRAAHRA